MRWLTRDGDAKFTASFDTMFRSELVRVIWTPVGAPRAITIAERFVGTVRRECLGRMLILGRRYLIAVLGEFVEQYNTHRPHRTIGQAPPRPSAPADVGSATPAATIVRTDRLGGLIHDYRLGV